MEKLESKNDANYEEREKFLEIAKDLEDTINLDKVVEEIQNYDK